MLAKLEAILTRHDQICANIQSNIVHPIFKLPKYLFIAHVLTFLDGEDLTSFGSTCRTFNAMVYNSYTFQILLSSSKVCVSVLPSPALPQVHSQTELGEEKKHEDLDAQNDIIAQLETLRTVKSFLTQQTKTLESVKRDNEKTMVQLKNDLVAAKERNVTNANKISYLEHQINLFDAAKLDHGDTVKELKTHYKALVCVLTFYLN